MEIETRPGFGFRPLDEELVGYYLRNKNLGNHSLVKDAINEVKIYSFDPWNLRYESKIKSRDKYWYFFCSKEKGGRQSRTTSSGAWKITGERTDVVDKWGIYGVAGVIGYKKNLGFSKDKNSKGIKSEWVMQEFHYTLLPEYQRSYVVCRLEYKGNDKNILLENATDPTPTFVPNMTYSSGSVVDQPVQGYPVLFPHFDELTNNVNQMFLSDFDTNQSLQGNAGSFNSMSDSYSAIPEQWLTNNFNIEQQAHYLSPYGHETEMDWNRVIEENQDSLVDESMYTQNFSDHKPKNPVTGVLPDDSSASDTDSMIGGDTSSFTDSVASSNGPCHTPIDDILSSSKQLKYVVQQQPKQLQGREKVINKQICECKMAEESIKKTPSTDTVKHDWIVLEEMSQRKSQWIYMRNIIISFLLLISIFGWNVLVG